MIGQADVHKISYSKVGLANSSVIEQQKVEDEDKYRNTINSGKLTFQECY